MEITIKLFAFLTPYLPSKAQGNVASLTIAVGSSVNDVIEKLRVPKEHCHLVLLDGVYIPREERKDRKLSPGQVLAIWPMVAGG